MSFRYKEIAAHLDARTKISLDNSIASIINIKLHDKNYTILADIQGNDLNNFALIDSVLTHIDTLKKN